MPRMRRVQLDDPVAERERVLAVTRQRHRAKKAKETPGQKMKRLETDRIYKQHKRFNETSEKREKRLEIERNRHKKRREMLNYHTHYSDEDSNAEDSKS